jgi:hypothetical protein
MVLGMIVLQNKQTLKQMLRFVIKLRYNFKYNGRGNKAIY